MERSERWLARWMIGDCEHPALLRVAVSLDDTFGAGMHHSEVHSFQGQLRGKPPATSNRGCVLCRRSGATSIRNEGMTPIRGNTQLQGHAGRSPARFSQGLHRFSCRASGALLPGSRSAREH